MIFGNIWISNWYFMCMFCVIFVVIYHLLCSNIVSNYLQSVDIVTIEHNLATHCKDSQGLLVIRSKYIKIWAKAYLVYKGAVKVVHVEWYIQSCRSSWNIPRSCILKTAQNSQCPLLPRCTVKPVCNDHLYNKFYYLWFIQQCVLIKTEGTNLLVLTISAFWSSSRWPLAT